MQWRDSYPTDAVRNCCFLTGDYDTSEGVVDLDLWLDDMPMYGRMCLSPKAVRMLMSCFGWVLPPQNVAEANRALIEENRGLRLRVARLEKAVAAVLDAGYYARLGPFAEEWREPADEFAVASS